MKKIFKNWSSVGKLIVSILALTILVSGAAVSLADSTFQAALMATVKEELADELDGKRDCSQPHKYKGKDGHCHCDKGYKKVEDADAEHRCQYAPCEGIEEEVAGLTEQVRELQMKKITSQNSLQIARAELQKYSVMYSSGAATSTATSTKTSTSTK